MHAKTVGALALSLAALSGSMAAHAASETLTYTSADFTSTYGNVAPNSDFTVTLTLDTALGVGRTSSYTSSDLSNVVFTTVQGGSTDVQSFTSSQLQGSDFFFTTNALGQITGWDFTAGLLSPTGFSTPSNNSMAVPYEIMFHSCSNESCTSGNYNSQNYGATGDWYDYKPSSSTAADACTYNPANGCGTTGGSATAVGKWTVAPEVNAANAGTALTLLFGALAVLIGRRRATLAAAN